MTNRSPYDVPAANECHDCEGRGYTYNTTQIGKQTPSGYVTNELGYGCLNCRGVGRLAHETSFGTGRIVDE